MNAQNLDRIRFVTRHFTELQGKRIGLPLGLFLVGCGGMLLIPFWPVRLVSFEAILAAILSFVPLGRSFGYSYYRKKFGEVEQLPALYGAELSAVSVYSPAGLSPLTSDRRPASPVRRWLLVPAAVALGLFAILWMVSPSVAIVKSGSAWDPWVQFNTPVVEVGEHHLLLWNYLNPALTEALYAVCGACFVGVWLWRERRLSQSHYLLLGALLLGLAAFGGCLGLALCPRDVWTGVRSAIPTSALWFPENNEGLRFILLALSQISIAMILCGAAIILAGLLDHWQLVWVLKPMREEAA